MNFACLGIDTCAPGFARIGPVWTILCRIRPNRPILTLENQGIISSYRTVRWFSRGRQGRNKEPDGRIRAGGRLGSMAWCRAPAAFDGGKIGESDMRRLPWTVAKLQKQK